MAKNWLNRSRGYKIGCIMLLVGTGMYIIGFSSPFWLQTFVDGHYGLWLYCYNIVDGGEKQCETITGYSILVSWFKAVQVLQSVALAGLFISCLYAFIVNCCCCTAHHYSRFLECFSGLSGLTGFIGLMLFVGNTSAAAQFYHWAFAVDLTGCLLIILASIVLFCNNPSQSTPQSNWTTTGGTPVIMNGQTYPPFSCSTFATSYTPGMNAQPGANPSALPVNGGFPSAPPPQGYSWYPPTGSTPSGYSGGGYNGLEPPPSYESVLSYTTYQPPQYGSQYAPQLEYTEGSKTPQ